MRVTATDIANSIRMTRSVHKHKAALIVEGLKDVRFYRLLTDLDKCFITPADGKCTATASLEELRKTNDSGVLVVVDADLSTIRGTAAGDPDIVVTDHHDLEALLLHDYAIEKVLSENDLEPDAFGHNIRGLLAAAAISLGYVRWASEELALGLRFKDMDYRSFVNADLTTNESKMLSCVLRNTGTGRITTAELQIHMLALRDPTHDVWAICCGHDISGIFAAAISKLTGKPVTGSIIERNLRLAYNPASFCDTQMYVRIRDWESRNAPYSVLRIACP